MSDDESAAGDDYSDAEAEAEWRIVHAMTYVNPDPDGPYGWCYAAKTIIADRREVQLIQWSTGAALSVGLPGDPMPGIYEDQWLYQRKDWALEAFQKWNGEGEPERWFRQAGTPRRRTDGDPNKEYEQW